MQPPPPSRLRSELIIYFKNFGNFKAVQVKLFAFVFDIASPSLVCRMGGGAYVYLVRDTLADVVYGAGSHVYAPKTRTHRGGLM